MHSFKRTVDGVASSWRMRALMAAAAVALMGACVTRQYTGVCGGSNPNPGEVLVCYQGAIECTQQLPAYVWQCPNLHTCVTTIPGQKGWAECDLLEVKCQKQKRKCSDVCGISVPDGLWVDFGSACADAIMIGPRCP